MVFRPLKGLSANLDSLVYSPHLESDEEGAYPFAYTISITNASKSPVTIFGRKWIIHGLNGSTEVIEGEGVVGKKPTIEPGETFTYNSYHLIKNTSSVTGTFFGKTKHGRKVFALLPAFEVHPPTRI